MRSTPAFAAAPHGGMGRHEAMALAGPTPDNPFLTLKKRLKRAGFHDRRERLDYEELLAGQHDLRPKPARAWDVAQRPGPAERKRVGKGRGVSVRVDLGGGLSIKKKKTISNN